MRIGAFEIREPLPEIQEPDALAILRPWIDAGSCGTLVINWLEKLCQARTLGELHRPGIFFDFTRYRPTLLRPQGRYQVILPNTYVTYGTLPGGRDFLFFHLLEPHMFGEVYVASILKLLELLNARRYLLIGSMYDYVPHTRPLLVSGGTAGKTLSYQMEIAGVRASQYEGPTSIVSLITERAFRAGMEAMTMIVHLPQYTELEEDYAGAVRLMQVISSLYGTEVDKVSLKRAERQREQINEAVAADPDMKRILEQLEAHYDLRYSHNRPESREQTLAPDVERFLKEMEKKFGQDKN